MARRSKDGTVEIGDRALAERARTDGMIRRVARFGDFQKLARAPAPQLKPAERVRHSHKRNFHRAVAFEVGDAGGIEPAIGRSDGRRLGKDREAPVASPITASADPAAR